MTICYKVVSRYDDKLFSLYKGSLWKKEWQVEYTLGEPAQAETGKLFAFTDMNLAMAWCRQHPGSEVYEAIATGAEPMPWCLALFRVHTLGQAFWSEYTLGINIPQCAGHLFSTPSFTIVADTITLIRQLD